MKRYKKGYVEMCGGDIQAVITKITVTEENGLDEIDEEELRRFGGFESKDEAIEFLKSSNVKEIEVEE